MIFGLVLALHILVALVLITIVLLQGGKGGLSDALGGAAAQSLFGGGANTVLTRFTAVCAALFMVTCLSLAWLSSRLGPSSVIESLPADVPGAVSPLTVPAPSSSSVPPSESQSPTPEPQAPSSPEPEVPISSPANPLPAE